MAKGSWKLPNNQRIAKALAGLPAEQGTEMGEPGLQQPAFDPVMLAAGLLGPAALNAFKGVAGAAPGLLANESGAIFPEGAALPGNRGLAKQMMDVLPDAQQAYRRNEALANWHASNYDFPAVLRDKWALLKHTGGS